MEKKDLRIVFLGTPEFAVESLDRIVKEGFNVVGVVTMPDKPAGRGHKMYQSPVKDYAVAHGLPLLQPSNLKDPEFLRQLRAWEGNLFVVIAFRMLPKEVWQMPALGTFNLHASLLPLYRGAAPINWAVINGEKQTGVTTFFLKHEIDTGDVLRQETIDILPEENVGSVHDRLMRLGATVTVDTLNHILAGDLEPIAQEQLMARPLEEEDKKMRKRYFAPKIFKETCEIDWQTPVKRLHNFIRGLSPYPGAWTTLYDADNFRRPPLLTMKMFSSRIPEFSQGDYFVAVGCPAWPGTVKICDEKMFVSTGEGLYLEILEVQPLGKKRMPVADFLRGAHLPNHLIFKHHDLP